MERTNIADSAWKRSLVANGWKFLYSADYCRIHCLRSCRAVTMDIQPYSAQVKLLPMWEDHCPSSSLLGKLGLKRTNLKWRDGDIRLTRIFVVDSQEYRHLLVAKTGTNLYHRSEFRHGVQIGRSYSQRMSCSGSVQSRIGWTETALSRIKFITINASGLR